MRFQLIFNVFFSDSHNRVLSVQSKAQRLSTREFSGRSIKDRAVLLSSMFPGSNKPPPAPLSPLSASQVVYSTDHFFMLD